MDFVIRKKKREDCLGVAKVVTTSWNETYRGIVADDFLDNLYHNEAERVTNSINNFSEDNHEYVLEVNNKIVGFISVGSADSEQFPDCGEIFAIYIINEYKGHGYGRKLIEKGIEELKKMGYDKMVIGCLAGNNTNNFYEHIGGKLIKTRVFEKLQLPENVYYFENI